MNYQKTVPLKEKRIGGASPAKSIGYSPPKLRMDLESRVNRNDLEKDKIHKLNMLIEADRKIIKEFEAGN